eukprot:evm.model.NODE_25915_length_48178_cov_38.282433.15
MVPVLVCGAVAAGGGSGCGGVEGGTVLEDRGGGVDASAVTAALVAVLLPRSTSNILIAAGGATGR